MTIVDIHCHTFNGDDLPVRGFVRRVAGNRVGLARLLAGVIDKVVQAIADDVTDELATLEALLVSPGGEEAVLEDVLATADAEADLLLQEATLEDPVLVEQAAAEVLATEPGGEEGVVDAIGDLRRYVRWAALFGKKRLALTRALIRTYGGVDLFTPLLVDFMGLEDEPKAGMLQQLAVNERISLLGMRGDLGAAVHPFVGCDPRRLGAVSLAQQAVEHYGCIGVKLYPLMGFRPIGNVADPPKGMTAEDAVGVDDALRRLYEWCQAEQVPITAHSNPSNEADTSFLHFSSPANWAKVLSSYPDLHVNLGHFGWGGRKQGWPTEIARLTATHEHLYADIGNHALGEIEETLGALGGLFGSPETAAMRGRFMFGTDWFMVASHRDYESFLDRWRDDYSAAFPDDVDRFLGGAALSFLGFDDPQNHNRARLRARYEQHSHAVPAWLGG